MKRTLAIALLLAAASPALADDWKAVGSFGWFGVGKAGTT